MISGSISPSVITIAVADEAASVRQFKLAADQSVFIGTSPNCGLPLTGADVSDMHCYMKHEEGKLWLEDWMSKTGTFVNGKAISTRVEVNWGDVIQVGPHKLALDGAAPANQISTASSGASSANQADQVAAKPLVNDSSVNDSSGTQTSDGVQWQAFVGDADIADSAAPDPADTGFDVSFFKFDDEETYDAETVSLLRNEIEHLQAALARRDAEDLSAAQPPGLAESSGAEDTDSTLQRIQELIDDANRSDERVSLLEEMLQAADDANRAEQDERRQLEAWVDDIEKRVGQREDEHRAEMDALRQRLDESGQVQERLLEQLRQAANSGTASKVYEEHLEKLQRSCQQLQNELDESRQQCASLQQRVGQASAEQERAIREERAHIAREHAKLARMRHEVSSKLAAFENLPKSGNQLDLEAAHRIKALREHLCEIHEQEKEEEKAVSLAARLTKLWQRVEY